MGATAQVWCRLAAISVGVALLATGCFPRGNISERMPLLATWTEAGAIEVVFPLCEGEAVANTGVTVKESGAWWVLRQGDTSDRASSDEIVTIVIDETNLAEGSLTDRWPTIEAFAQGQPTDVAKVSHFFVEATNGGAGILVSQIGNTGSWLIDGDAIDHHAAPAAVTRDEGLATIGAFCDGD